MRNGELRGVKVQSPFLQPLKRMQVGQKKPHLNPFDTKAHPALARSIE